jgi:hypothetical protein
MKSNELAGKALDKVVPYTWTKLDYEEIHNVLAYHQELIVKETIQACQQQWYDLNNQPKVDQGPRDVAIRVGQKNGLLQAMSVIKKRFGIKDLNHEVCDSR